MVKKIRSPIPRPPTWLSAEAQAIWRQTIAMIPGGYQPSDQAAITAYCNLVAGRESFRRTLAREDLEPGARQQLEVFARDNDRRIFEYAAKLGLTPASRRNINRTLSLTKARHRGQ